jgi:tRNA(Ile)-lysidine synthase
MSVRSLGQQDARLLFLASQALSDLKADPLPLSHLGLAVSGGGDSMAMLWLLAPWAREQGIAVSVATVDHGLRPESADEARFVAEACRDLGVPHTVLLWQGWDSKGNLQAAAREARLSLLSAWAQDEGIDTLATAHTSDDQAETFLLRLARGSGVDGLAPMVGRRDVKGQRWVRPMLPLTREQLRQWLVHHGHGWREDPSNADTRFSRVRARRALEALEPLGIDQARLHTTAVLLGWAGDALRQYAVEAAARIATVRHGDVSFDYLEFCRLPAETHLRLASEAIRWVSGATYRPRLSSLQDSLVMAGTQPRTLQGTLIRFQGQRPTGSRLVIGREPRAAARARSVPTSAIWDSRWRLTGPHAPDLEVRMLGEAGLALCPDWREAGLERSSVLASPAVWRGQTLVAAPLAGRAGEWTAEVSKNFLSALNGGG